MRSSFKINLCSKNISPIIKKEEQYMPCPEYGNGGGGGYGGGGMVCSSKWLNVSSYSIVWFSIFREVADTAAAELYVFDKILF